MDRHVGAKKEGDRAASPVIGVLLVAVLTMVLSTIFAGFVLGFGSDLGRDAPLASLSLSPNADAETVDVEHMGGDELDSSTIRIIVENDSVRQHFAPTSISSTLSPGEVATIDLSLVDGDNRVDWNPTKTGWEYEQSGSFDGFTRTEDLSVSVIHVPTNELLLSATIPRIGPTVPTPTPTATPSPTPTPTPPGPADPGHAYIDKNENGVWDDGIDEKIPDAEVTDGIYDAGSEALVIPDSVGSISASRIDFDGSAITIGVDLTSTGSQDLTVTTSNGLLTIEDVTVESAFNRQTVLRGAGGVRANGTTIDSGQAITVRSNNGEVHFSSATANATAKAGDIQFTSNGDMYLESTSITTHSGNAADAALGESSATLYVDGASISDGDSTLSYQPSGVTVDGTPTSGSVTAG